MKSAKTISLPTRTVEFNYFQLEELLNSLYPFWVNEATKGNMSREDLYRDVLLKKYYEKLRRRQFNMLASSKKIIREKVDPALATLLVDVLQRINETTTGNMVIMKVAGIVPPQMLIV